MQDSLLNDILSWGPLPVIAVIGSYFLQRRPTRAVLTPMVCRSNDGFFVKISNTGGSVARLIQLEVPKATGPFSSLPSEVPDLPPGDTIFYELHFGFGKHDAVLANCGICQVGGRRSTPLTSSATLPMFPMCEPQL